MATNCDDAGKCDYVRGSRLVADIKMSAFYPEWLAKELLLNELFLNKGTNEEPVKAPSDREIREGGGGADYTRDGCERGAFDDETKVPPRPLQDAADEAEEEAMQNLKKELGEQIRFLSINEQREAMGHARVAGANRIDLPQNPQPADDETKAPSGETEGAPDETAPTFLDLMQSMFHLVAQCENVVFDMLAKRGVHEITFRFDPGDVSCFIHGPWAGIPVVGRGKDRRAAFHKASDAAFEVLAKMDKDGAASVTPQTLRDVMDNLNEEERQG